LLGTVTDSTYSGNAPTDKLFLYTSGSSSVTYDDFGGGPVVLSTLADDSLVLTPLADGVLTVSEADCH